MRMETRTVVLRHTKDTKGTHVYATAEGEEAIVTLLYLKKEQLAKGEMRPDAIRLTIEEYVEEAVDADGLLEGLLTPAGETKGGV